jgi:hypothetical protein
MRLRLLAKSRWSTITALLSQKQMSQLIACLDDDQYVAAVPVGLLEVLIMLLLQRCPKARCT